MNNRVMSNNLVGKISIISYVSHLENFRNKKYNL